MNPEALAEIVVGATGPLGTVCVLAYFWLRQRFAALDNLAARLQHVEAVVALLATQAGVKAPGYVPPPTPPRAGPPAPVATH
jgi:hypothetical protein